MSIESWDPNIAEQQASYQLDREFLLNIIGIRQKEPNREVSDYFTTDEKQKHSAMMKLDRQTWLETTADFETEQLLSLIEFLTLAEMKIPSWEVGAESPVIHIVKFLRQRKTPPSKEILLWIKANSSNRFLPNGAL